MKKAFYRIRQWGFSLVIGLVSKETKLVRGEKSLLKLPGILKDDKIDSALVVTTAGFIKRGTLASFFAELEKESIKYGIFTNVTPDPSVSDVELGVEAYKNAGAGAIIAIGGGSVLDCAKVIGARVSNPGMPVRKMRGMLKVRKALPPYYPVPATCGTGSEVTAAAVISDIIDGKHYKFAVNDFKLVPKMAVLDPDLLTTLPQNMLLTTAMDAVTHAMEAYTNKFASKSVTRDALEAVKLVFDNVEKGYKEKDIKALDNLLFGSTLAGIAFTHNFVGYVHAIAHAMGAIYGLPHGYLNAIILPVMIKKYEPKIEGKMKVLCEYTDTKVSGSYTDSVIARLNRINALGNLPKTINELKPEDYDEIVKRALKEANPAYPVPIIFSEKELREVLVELTRQDK